MKINRSGIGIFNNQKPFNEIIAIKLYERILDKDIVPYELMQGNDIFYSACPTIKSTDEELVSAYYIVRTLKLRENDSLYEHFLEACNALDIPNAKLHIDKMIIRGYIIANYDCHYRNFGAIRNSIKLKRNGIAPIFGNNYHCRSFKFSP